MKNYGYFVGSLALAVALFVLVVGIYFAVELNRLEPLIGFSSFIVILVVGGIFCFKYAWRIKKAETTPKTSPSSTPATPPEVQYRSC